MELAVEQVAASLKRVCLRRPLTGRQLGQTLHHGWPGDDLTRNRAAAAQAGHGRLEPWMVRLLLRQRTKTLPPGVRCLRSVRVVRAVRAVRAVFLPVATVKPSQGPLLPLTGSALPAAAVTAQVLPAGPRPVSLNLLTLSVLNEGLKSPICVPTSRRLRYYATHGQHHLSISCPFLDDSQPRRHLHPVPINHPHRPAW